MMTAATLGWVLWGISFFFLLRTARLDRRLVKFRVADAPAGAYLREFGRWRRALYSPEGQALIAPTRWALALFFVFFLLGVIVFETAPETIMVADVSALPRTSLR
jgi:hypothetical protein